MGKTEQAIQIKEIEKAILEELNRGLTIRELLKRLNKRFPDSDVKDLDVKDAVWHLISECKVELTSERRLKILNPA